MARRRAQRGRPAAPTDLDDEEPDDLDDLHDRPVYPPAAETADGSRAAPSQGWRAFKHRMRTALAVAVAHPLSVLACLALLGAGGLYVQGRSDQPRQTQQVQEDEGLGQMLRHPVRVSVLSAALTISEDRQSRDSSGRRLALLRLPVVNHGEQPVALAIRQVGVPHVVLSGDPVIVSVATSSSAVLAVPIAVDCSGLAAPPLSEIAGVDSGATTVMLDVGPLGRDNASESLTQPLVISERWTSLAEQLDYACRAGSDTT